MNRIHRLIFLSLFFANALWFVPPAASMAAPLTLDTIKNTYRRVNEIHGEGEQIKTSPLLLRPLKSKVSLSLEKGLLTWRGEGQEPWRIKFGVDGKPEFLGVGKTLEQMPPAARAKLDSTVALVRNILTMDPKLEQDFNLAIKDGLLTVEPKPGNRGVFFQSVNIQFKPSGLIESIRFKTQDDETLLLFKTMKIKSL